LKVIDLSLRGRSALSELVEMMSDSRPSIRWWASRSLGNMGLEAKAAEAVAVLTEALTDSSGGVRVEAARALCKMDLESEGMLVLLEELDNPDQVVRHYAALA
jgi:HEAT repeat protein